ncbi:SNF2-related protein [Alkalihalobacillus macyae]|uniref:DEAD/DEAH box helicase n=1 Tax=Guptibacillus hwajinpoensis TaxID=208199 RepID=UPI00273AD0AD|nr:SNF2-related protein [Alkalihalobacillus macyae]MDP4550220.1 SNF2-related protein [Alkalihalobacillus macyae]
MRTELHFDQEWTNNFIKQIEEDGPWANWELFKLAIEAEKHTAIPSFTGLQAPAHLPHLTPHPYQLEAARRVVEEMNGKAILADEVGLGKTIEAGLIIKEYMIRGLVKKVLILVPASLVSQWAIELNQKFYIPAVVQRKSYVWDQCDVIVSSIDTAKREPHRSIVYDQQYDMVIIDEAHRLKNSRTKNYEFVQHLPKKFCLLLTATPVQNRLDEVFNLVSLLKPGHLGSYENFEKDYKGKEKSIEDEERLKALIQKVMVRNRREDTGMDWPERIVETVPITLSPEEEDLYRSVEALKKEPVATRSQFSIITLLREICSSREAAYMTLKKMLEKENATDQARTLMTELIKKIEGVPTNSKAQKALELIQSIEGKVIIFTEYRATQLYLQWFLKEHGITSVPFRGGFKRGKKDWMKELFKNHAKVLIATEAGGEGINLQFCQHVINYDLPWNPMRIEQRIGRIHRLGQESDVHIYNFATKHTVEEHILTLLYEKIQLFESVIGQLDEILTRLGMRDIEKHISDILLHSESEGEIRIKMENIKELINYQQNQKEDTDATRKYS